MEYQTTTTFIERKVIVEQNSKPNSRTKYRLEMAKKCNESFQKEIGELKKERELLKRENELLKAENEALKVESESLRVENASLRKKSETVTIIESNVIDSLQTDLIKERDRNKNIKKMAERTKKLINRNLEKLVENIQGETGERAKRKRRMTSVENEDAGGESNVRGESSKKLMKIMESFNSAGNVVNSRWLSSDDDDN